MKVDVDGCCCFFKLLILLLSVDRYLIFESIFFFYNVSITPIYEILTLILTLLFIILR